MKVRVKSTDGKLHTLTVEKEDKLSTFLANIHKLTGVSANTFMLKQGVPPHAPIQTTSNDATIDSLGIRHGDSVMMVPISNKSSEGPKQEVLVDRMVRIPIADDNSCLFNSLGFVLLGQDTSQAGILRNIVAETVEKDPATYSEVFLGLPPARYISKILSPDVWGGGIELSIFSKYFSTEIVAIDVENVTPMIFGEGSGYSKRVYILYSGIHYDAIALKVPGGYKTSFDVDDDVAYAEALSIADNERKNRNFTNTYTFTLQCSICKVAVKGQAEAQDHAAKTGHASFQEYSK